MCFCRRDASTNMQHDLSGSPRHLMFPWPEVNYLKSFLGTPAHISTGLDEMNTVASQLSFRLFFLIQKLFAKKNVFVKTSILTFLELCSPLTRAPTRGRAGIRPLPLRFFINAEKPRHFVSLFTYQFCVLYVGGDLLPYQGQVTRSLGMTRCQATFLHIYRCARAAVDD